jgi:copper chaperone CopZ
MATMTTAILHFQDPSNALVGAALEQSQHALTGVHRIEVQPRDSIIAVRFDQDVTGIAEIVRAFEDVGSHVSGVAQRSM